MSTHQRREQRLVLLLATALIGLTCGLLGCGTESMSPAYSNNPPEILFISVLPGDSVEVNDTLGFECDASDPDNDPLKFRWFSEGGQLLGDTTLTPRWVSPNRPGNYVIFLTVSDPFDDTTGSYEVVVLTRGATNRAPQIVRMTAEPDTVTPGDGLDAVVQATDAEGDALTYIWTSSAGTFFPESGPQVRWFAPQELGNYYLKATVIDGHHSTSDSITVTVVPDTTVLFSADFTTDQVTGQWSSVGLLGGLGDNEGIHSVAWDSLTRTMAVTSKTNYGTYGFRLVERNFGEGTFTVSVQVPNAQYGRIAFVPKLIDPNNYLIIGINPFQGAWQVLRCVAGATLYLGEGWETFQLDQPLLFRYVEANRRGTALLNGRTLWQGAIAAPFDHEVPLGVALYGLNDSAPALFDNLRVTMP